MRLRNGLLSSRVWLTIVMLVCMDSTEGPNPASIKASYATYLKTQRLKSRNANDVSCSSRLQHGGLLLAPHAGCCCFRS